MSRKLLVSVEEAQVATKQHTKPCGDCPWRRDSLNGWLGGLKPQEWIGIAHSDEVVDCHTLKGAQCAGAAIYRRNTCKMAYPPNLLLPADREKIFSNRNEFLEHHSKAPEKK